MEVGEDPETIRRILDIGRTVLTESCRAFSAKGLAFFGLNDFSQREGHLSFAQEEALKKHFTDHPPLKTSTICVYILAEYGQNYSASRAAKLMKRLDFEYKKPIALARQADEVAQQAIMDWYQALLNLLLPVRKFCFRTPCIPSIKAVRLMGDSRRVKWRRLKPHRVASGSISRAQLISKLSPTSKARRSILKPPFKCWNRLRKTTPR